MANINMSLLRLKRNKFVLFSYICLFTLICALALIPILNNTTTTDFWESLRLVLKFSPIYFVASVILSYEYLRELKTGNTEEILFPLKKARIKIVLASFFLLSAVTIIIYSLLLLIYVITIQMNDLSSVLITHTAVNLFLNYCLIPFFGIILGMIISNIKRKYLSYGVLAAVSITWSGLLNYLAELSDMYNINLYKLTDCFNLFTPALNKHLPAFGFSVLSYRWSILFFWIFIAIAVLLMIYNASVNKLKKTVVCSICVVLAALCFVDYIQPSSKVLMNHNPEQGLFADYYYYQNLVMQESDGEVEVSEYDLNISINKQLEVSATIHILNSPVSEANFTLYHGYEVISVKDGNNSNLSFKQNGDTISIFDIKTDTICVEYKGHHPKYYSNSQGIALPGYLAFYPQAGQKKVYDEEGLEYCTLEETTLFNIKVDYEKTVFSNLEATDFNTFSGQAKSLTLFSGILTSREINGINVIYANSDSNLKESSVESTVLSFRENNNTEQYKKIFIFPSLNATNNCERTSFFDDYLITCDFYSIENALAEYSIPKQKNELYNYFLMYKNELQSFKEEVSVQEANLPPEVQKRSCILLMNEKINELGVEYTINNIEKYIYNNNDDREWFQFLNELK